MDTRGFQLNRQGKIAIAMGSEGHEAVQAGTGAAFVRGKDCSFRTTATPARARLRFSARRRLPLAVRARDRPHEGPSDHQPRTDRARGIASISSIIASQVTHAVGAAYAMQLRGESDRAVFCTFGDGATSEGEWHEGLNFAAVHGVPVVFVCENNRWAISTPQSKQMLIEDVAVRAGSYGMPGVIVDGFDPLAVYEAVRAARERAVSGGGPTLVEAQCYRFLSHTTDDDDRTYRSRDEVDEHRATTRSRCSSGGWSKRAC